MKKDTRCFGDCRDESLVEELFGSVSEFARLVEKRGNSFSHGFRIRVEYDKLTDIHSFYEIIP